MDLSKLTRTVRALHRDIGFLMVGLTIIYCISGVLLTYKDTDFLKSEQLVTKTIESNLEGKDLGKVMHKKVQVVSEDEGVVIFKDGTPENGTYNKSTGEIAYVDMRLPGILEKFNQLHKTSSKRATHIFTIVYAVLLSFLAASSFFMYKLGSRALTRGVVLSLCGVGIAVLMVL